MINEEYNSEAIGAVIAADVRGDSKPAMKPLYVRRNAFAVDLDQPIYRIAPLQYVMEDRLQGWLTHSRVSPKVWGDTNENPLLNRVFLDKVTGGPLRLKALVENMFGSCWSLSPLDGWYDWMMFCHGKPGVRIESTPRRLLTAAMNDANPYYELRHAIGKVSYLTVDQLAAIFDREEPWEFLDSLGHGILLSLMKLGDGVEGEAEVRLVCDFVQTDLWMQQNMSVEGKVLRVPFDWTDVIRAVVIGPNVPPEKRDAVREDFRKFGVMDGAITQSTAA